MRDEIDAGRVNRALTGTRFAQKFACVGTIGSTNTALLEAAADGADEGVALLADEQTAGRGRGSHAWHSEPGDGLYCSALVKPSLRLEDALLLSLATGLAVQEAIRAVTGIGVDLRWPNDLMIGERKLGGILVETAVEPGADARLRYAVIGIGINVRQQRFPAELSEVATSLAMAMAEPAAGWERGALVMAILRGLDLELNRLEEGDRGLLERFSAASSWVRGKDVHVPEQGGYTGRTSGLDSRGFLRVATGEGEQRTVLSGGVRAASS